MVVLYCEVTDMLKKFLVENYKGFKNQLLWDLSQTKDYAYSKDWVCNKIVKKALKICNRL